MSRILNGDVLETLGTLDSDSIDCCVTSPPYWGLRDYGHDGQIGLEKTPQEFVGKMVDVFREVRRVLKPSGTCWVNLGDSYTAGGNGPGLLKYQEQSIGSATGPAQSVVVQIAARWDATEEPGRHPMARGLRPPGRWLVPATRHHLEQAQPHARERDGPMHEGP